MQGMEEGEARAAVEEAEKAVGKEEVERCSLNPIRTLVPQVHPEPM